MNEMKKQQIRTIYIPISNQSNKYVELVQTSMKQNGISVSGIKDSLNIIKLCQTDIVNLNWFEGRVNKKRIVSCIGAYIANSVLLSVLKLFGIKIVVTIHNGNTHDAHHPEIVRRFYKKICNKAHALVIMNEYSKQVLAQMGVKHVDEKSILIHHPSYTGAYEASKKKMELAPEFFHVAFIGQVRPYKNIELILQVAEQLKEEKICFHICGYADQEAYRHKIEMLAEGKNVSLHLKYIEDDEMAGWMDAVDAVLLPYNMKTSLNSGVSILAFSYGTTVIGTKTGTLREYPEELVYAYEYANDEEHIQNLAQNIRRAYAEFVADRAAFAQKGAELKRLVNEKGSIEKIGQQYRMLYEKLARANCKEK